MLLLVRGTGGIDDLRPDHTRSAPRPAGFPLSRR